MGNKHSRQQKYNVNKNHNSTSNNNNNNNNNSNSNSNNSDDNKSSYQNRSNDQQTPALVVPATQATQSPKVDSASDSEKVVMSKTAFVPKWVQKDVFEDVLKETVDQYEKIEKFEAYPALGAGENYATQMLRVAITMQLKDKSSKDITFMLKVAHESEQMLQMLKSWDFFLIENLMYSEALPALEKLYKDKGLDICFGAKGYQLKNSPSPYCVLLEDLKPKGFKNASRREGLNMEHCKGSLKKLAQYHAASAAYLRNVKHFHEVLMKGLGDPNSPASRAIFEGMMGSMKTSVLNTMHLYKDIDVYEKLIRQRLDDLVDDFLISMTADHLKGFCVLTHGDFWSNNILFSYNEDGSLKDTYLVDFQASKVGSATQDLLYFIMSSSQLELKTSQFDYLVRYYHEELVHHLKFLDYPLPIPTLRDLHLEILEQGFFAYITVIMTLPVVLLDPNENANFENFMDGTNSEALNFKNLSYTNPRYIKHVNEILPFLYNRGLLEPYASGSFKAKGLTVKLEEPAPQAKALTETKPAGPVIPDWLTKDCFLDILKEKHANFKEIKDFEIKAGSNAGDNYATSLLCINIDSELSDGSQVHDSFMMKVSLASEQSNALMSMFDVFIREVEMYHSIIPMFEQMYKAVGHEVTFGPKGFRFSQDPGYKYVLLENLKTKGFQNEDRLVGLDMEHTKAVLRKLAQFHAVSATYVQTKGQFADIFCKGMFTEETRPFFESMGDKFYNTFLEIVATYDGSSEYIDKLQHMKTAFFDQMMDLTSVHEEDFNVMNHGDCWANNIMFQNNSDGTIAQTYLIDYQMCKYGSPAQDLYYFLYSSPQLELKMEQFDYFIKYYHDNLIQNLEALKYPGEIPTLKQLHLDLIKKHGWGVSVVSGVMAAVLLPPSDDANMENWMGDDDAGMAFKRKMYNNPTYRLHASTILTYFNQKGYLDIGEEYVQQKKTQSVIPEWINEHNFAEILADKVENFEKIKSFKAETGTKTGDNYASLMLRVTIEVQLKDGLSKTVAFMVKALPLSSLTDEMVSSWNFFPKESLMYQTYIPAFEKIFKDVGVDVKFAPKYFEFKTPIKADNIILEDLGLEGFKNGNRFEGLDELHTKSVLKKMAQLHAASARYLELHGPYPEILHIGLFKADQVDLFKGMIENSEPSFLECAKTYKNSDLYFHKLENLRARSIDKAVELSVVDPNEFNVLNHGDSWLNNIMFQHDEQGNIKETLYVDFQVCKYDSPAQDLYYFLMSSTHVDIKAAKFDEHIQFYHQNLVENLKLLKYEGKVPSLEEFQQTLKKYRVLGSMGLIGVGAVALLEPTEKATMENFTASDEEGKSMHKLMFGGENFRRHADVIFPWLNERGFFDI